jgi:hypothetical protein
MGIYLGGFQRRIPQNLLNSEDHHIEWLGRDAYTWNNPEYASQKTLIPGIAVLTDGFYGFDMSRVLQLKITPSLSLLGLGRVLW